jgi:hypothetical protein
MFLIILKPFFFWGLFFGCIKKYGRLHSHHLRVVHPRQAHWALPPEPFGERQTDVLFQLEDSKPNGHYLVFGFVFLFIVFMINTDTLFYRVDAR